MSSINTQEAKQTAEDAYIFAFSMPENYKTMYVQAVNENLPTPLFIANPIDRYSIGDRTPGFAPGPDGSVTIYLQHESPGPDKEANWLPAPDGPFALALRIYWPEQAALDGTWSPPPVVRKA